MNDSIRYSIPVALGYIPLGTAFGILFTTQTDYAHLYGILMSICIFAGSAQFLAVTMIANNAPLYDVFVITLLINARHIFYGLYMFHIYKNYCIKKRLYLLFTLTDETFSVISTLPPKLQHDVKTTLHISALNHCWWILGSTIGIILGSTLPLDIPSIAFVVTSLFVVLLIERLHQTRELFPIFCACIAAAISLVFFSEEHFLFISLLIGSVLFSLRNIYVRYLCS